MRASLRDDHAAMVFCCQFDAEPLMASRGIGPEIDAHVEQLALRAPDKLCLGERFILKVHPAYRTRLHVE